ncbi:ABC transporter ATP-binding protein [Microlunatus parietis]|uniref:ABC-type multidrug transport system fused ATPase/permease subunit n=1 Tax=Microlunatus parietis TaxID=682979 RepID=A0A7Y9I790_9ACTN|nr:ABC transporter ATP-binding protein [Microlunatus parietis]NYE71059.1 ABC-type multidrug transport system fused ATPase/permease subunit [Microlunatus parietis]
MTSLRPLLRLAAPYRRQVAGMLGFGILDQALAITSAAVGAWLVGSVITGASLTELRPGLVVLLLLVLPRALTAWLESYLAHDLAFRILMGTRKALAGAFDRLAPELLRGRRSGDLASTAMDDVERLEVFFAHTVGPLVVAVVMPTGSLIALAWIHPALTLTLLPVALLTASIPTWSRRRAEAQGAVVREDLGIANAEAIDGIQGVREVVSFGREGYFLDRLDRRTRRLQRAQRSQALRMGTTKVLTDGLVAIGTIAVLAVASYLVAGGHLSAALYPAAVVLAGAALAPIAKFGDAARELGVVSAALARVTAVLDAPSLVSGPGSRALPAGADPEIAVQAARYRYAPDAAPALDGATLTVRPGETVALVGPSGAGKSTLIKAILRYFDLDEGRITIGGVALGDLTEEALRQTITVVPQDVYLLNASVADNIALARPDASAAQIRAAAAGALADEFIADLPDGYDTVVGEWGAALSGGQRQRIAIARALLRDAPVLIMDEPSSNLDARSERELQSAMERVRAGRTTLIIAHRLSTIRSADRIAVIKAGRIVQLGTHEELTAVDGTYTAVMGTQLAAEGRRPGILSTPTPGRR